MAKVDDNVFPKVIQGINLTDQAAPTDASWKVYAKANGIFARSSNSVVGPFGTSSSASSLLAVASVNTSSNYTTTSATQADVDASNARIIFTAPASGNVIVRATVSVSISAANQNAHLGIRESTTNVVNQLFAIQGQTATAQELLVSWSAYVTGISAGSHTYKLAYDVNGGATFVIRSFAGAPILLEVWSAP